MSAAVARATYEGRRVLVVQNSEGGWAFADSGIDGNHITARWAAGSCLSDITPLVCLELTRHDADVLEEAERSQPFMASEGVTLMRRIRDGIREQTPEPLVLPENLGAVVEVASQRVVYAPECRYDPKPWAWDSGYRSDAAYVTSHGVVRVLSEGVA